MDTSELPGRPTVGPLNMRLSFPHPLLVGSVGMLKVPYNGRGKNVKSIYLDLLDSLIVVLVSLHGD